MTVNEQLRYWGIGFVVLALALWALGGVLTPFLVGAAIAYLSDPLADRLVARGASRTVATVLITAIAVLGALLAVAVLAPLMVDQIRELVTNVPGFAEQLREGLSARFPGLVEEGSALRDTLEGLREDIRTWSGQLLQRVWSSGVALIDFLALAVITPVVAFYLLHDWDDMIAEIDSWLPRQHAPVIRQLAREVDQVLAGFVRGQLTVCGILGAFYAIALMVVGLQFGLLIGVFAGLVSFIPYVGTILGGILSVGVALFQFWNDPVWIGVVALIFVVGQMVEGNFLTPKLVGGSVGLHPVWLMFALAAFGAMLGFTGLLIAVPAAAVIGVLGRFAVGSYKSSRLFLGPGGTPAGDSGEDDADQTGDHRE